MRAFQPSPLAAILVAGAVLLGTSAHASDTDPPEYWTTRAKVTPTIRAFAAPSVAYLSGSSQVFVGGSFSFGYESLFSIHPQANALFYGQAMGLELRTHALYSIGPPAIAEAESTAWLLATGIAFSSYIVSPSLGRFRTRSILGVMLPELGAAFRQAHGPSLYTRWDWPFAYLVTSEVALELDPSLSLLYDAPSGKPEALWQISFGFSWRNPGELPSPPRMHWGALGAPPSEGVGSRAL